MDGSFFLVNALNWLYEQGAGIVRIGDYVRRWCVWVRSGLVGLVVTLSSHAAADKMLQVPAVLRSGA
jgi:hypothetical protein